MLSRRSLLAAGLACSALGVAPRAARAAVARALTLSEMVRGSAYAVVGVAIDAFGQWERIGDRERIVTYTSLRLEESLDDREPDAQELTVRTLGGTVGDLGQVVAGEALFVRGEAAVAFLTPVTDGLFAVTGMAQGHFRLLRDSKGTRRLTAAKTIELIGADEGSAVRKLHQSSLEDARTLVQKELRGAH